MNETLEQEKERLLKRLEQLNVNSRGRERIVERLQSIRYELEVKRKPPPDEREYADNQFSVTDGTNTHPINSAS